MKRFKDSDVGDGGFEHNFPIYASSPKQGGHSPPTFDDPGCDAAQA